MKDLVPRCADHVREVFDEEDGQGRREFTSTILELLSAAALLNAAIVTVRGNMRRFRVSRNPCFLSLWFA